jgi:hypothetical protein
MDMQISTKLMLNFLIKGNETGYFSNGIFRPGSFYRTFSIPLGNSKNIFVALPQNAIDTIAFTYKNRPVAAHNGVRK